MNHSTLIIEEAQDRLTSSEREKRDTETAVPEQPEWHPLRVVLRMFT